MTPIIKFPKCYWLKPQPARAECEEKKHELVFAVFTGSWRAAARLGALTDYWLEWVERDQTPVEPRSDPSLRDQYSACHILHVHDYLGRM